MDESKKQKDGNGSTLTEADRKELDTLRVREKLRLQRDKAASLVKAAKLPEAVVSDFWLDQLAKLDSDSEIKAAIEDRRRIANVKTPVSSAPTAGQNQGSDNKPADVKGFKKSLFAGTGIK